MQPDKTITLQWSILRTLLYFDLFRYPLRPDEIFKFLGTNSITRSDLDEALDSLVHHRHVFHHGDFYSLQPGEELIKRRRMGNANAQRMRRLAMRKGKFIGGFPFVRAVMASGSFSKGYMDADSDLDFFVVTAPGRLWIARMLIVLYKRLFLYNSHKYFWCNYFISTDHLEIEEKNLFTATELATLIPLCGSSHHLSLMHSNPWLRDYFPNFIARAENIPEASSSWFKSAIESLLGGRLGDRLSLVCQKLTQRRWRRLYAQQYSSADFGVAFKSTASVSKIHPNNFQRRVLERYDEKLQAFSRNKFKSVHQPDL